MRLLLGLLAVVALVGGCRSNPPAPPPTSLVGTSWSAEAIDRRDVLGQVRSTLTFLSAGRVAGQAACNRYFGGLELGEGTIRVKPAGATRMACSPAVMDQESRFLAALAAATAFRHEGGKLLLLDEGGRVRVRLAPLPLGQAASEPSASAPLRARAFDCDDRPGFVVVLLPPEAGQSEAVDLILTDRRHRLSRVPTASGVRYEAGGISVWSKGRQALVDVRGRVSRCQENRRRSIRADARVRGAEFRASGNEPGWTWELLADRMVFVGAYGAERVATPRPPRQRGSTPEEAMYAAVTDVHRLSVRIRPTPCVDTMSGDRYAATVEVDLDGTVYQGCGDVLQPLEPRGR